MSSRLRSGTRWTAAGLFALAAAYLAAIKAGWVAARPGALAALAGAAAVALALTLALSVAPALRGPRRLSAAAEALAAAGLLAVVAGGLANWGLGQHGYVLLFEREPVRLSRAGSVGALERGPLADAGELDLTIALARLRLGAEGPAYFRPVSRLKVLDAAGEEVGIEVRPGQVARYRTLVFRQGAFGFAPRVVVTQGDRPILDTHVPFRTIREGGEGIAFVGEFDVDAERLRFRAAVTLDDLNDDMKGHPALEIEAHHEERPIGQGTLKPGEFADLSDGYRVGFAGLRRWSEIDFARRTYPLPILAGAAAFAAGVLLRAFASWRRRRTR